jgi:hypothetical protein
VRIIHGQIDQICPPGLSGVFRARHAVLVSKKWWVRPNEARLRSEQRPREEVDRKAWQCEEEERERLHQETEFHAQPILAKM